MKAKPNSLFSPSGCLTPQAFEMLKQGTLAVDEQQQALEHIKSCELCATAAEGLAELSSSQIDTDLKEVKSRIKIVRPLDFMPEKRGLKTKIKVRIVTLATLVVAAAVALLILSIFWNKPSRPSTVVVEEAAIPFRLEAKDTTAGKLERKLPNKRAKWEERIKRQHSTTNDTTTSSQLTQ